MNTIYMLESIYESILALCEQGNTCLFCSRTMEIVEMLGKEISKDGGQDENCYQPLADFFQFDNVEKAEPQENAAVQLQGFEACFCNICTITLSPTDYR